MNEGKLLGRLRPTPTSLADHSNPRVATQVAWRASSSARLRLLLLKQRGPQLIRLTKHLQVPRATQVSRLGLGHRPLVLKMGSYRPHWQRSHMLRGITSVVVSYLTFLLPRLIMKTHERRRFLKSKDADRALDVFRISTYLTDLSSGPWMY